MMAPGVTLDDLLQESPNLIARQAIEELHYVSVKIERMKKMLMFEVEKGELPPGQEVGNVIIY